MRLLAGCPVYDRNWIMPRWVEAVKREAEGAELSFAFVVGRDDPATPPVLEELCQGYPLHIEHVEGRQIDTYHRWDMAGFIRMADLRNTLLGVVREQKPDLFLCLDSDMLLNEGALAAMIAQTGRYDAVGINAGMLREWWSESWAYFTQRDGREFFEQRREPATFEGVKEVDLLMGGKLMTPKAYAVDYRFDHHGEHSGWAHNARTAGLRLCVTPDGTAEHVMNRPPDTVPDLLTEFWDAQGEDDEWWDPDAEHD
jgi:hypothetical protein